MSEEQKPECPHDKTMWSADMTHGTCKVCGWEWDETTFWHAPKLSLGEVLRQKRLANGIVMLEKMDVEMTGYLDKMRGLIEGGDYSAASYLARQLQVHLDKANTLANLLAELDK